MKCQNCGAEIGDNLTCQYCGSKCTPEMQKEQEQLRKNGCPKCGSTNIEFKRENQGEIRGANAKKIVHATVGFCKDCGHTWYPAAAKTQQPKKRKTWLWVLGWIFIFPVPLTILMLRKKEMKPILKYGIITAAWLLYILIVVGGNSGNKTAASTGAASGSSTSAMSSTQQEEAAATTSEGPSTTEEATTSDNRENAKEADDQLYTIITNAENDYNVLANLMNSGTASALDLYDTSKALVGSMISYSSQIHDVECDGMDDYKEAADNYVLNMELIASYVRDYADKQQMEDLSNAKKCIEDSSTHALNVVSQRMKFLSASGYTNEEVMSIMGMSDESSSGQ